MPPRALHATGQRIAVNHRVDGRRFHAYLLVRWRSERLRHVRVSRGTASTSTLPGPQPGDAPQRTGRTMERLDSIEGCLDRIIERCGRELVVGLPLGLGKPVPLINALYDRARRDPRLSLTICTALSLQVPPAGNGLQRRFLAPFLERYYHGVPELDYARDRRQDRLPGNVEVIEFYFSPGSLLGNDPAQRNYISSNYTHAARDLLDRGVNLILQMVAETDGRLSLSCNPDLSLDLVPALRRRNPDCLVVGMANRALPFLPNDAEVDPDFFDLVVDIPDGHAPPFPVPNPRIGPVAHAIGLHASTLVRDGGTLQVGIGDLGDGFCHALRLRDTHNARYGRAISALGIDRHFADVIAHTGDLQSLTEKLYGASEMFTNGLLQLYQAGVLNRQVPAGDGDDIGAYVVEAAFFLGPADFYQALREMPADELALINMTAVSKVNQLYGDERLARANRRAGRFINTCIKVTLNGAAAADTLAGGQVLSGVGGQYNFVAMAHALEDARSILMLRSTRTGGDGRTESNIVPEYGQCTIPRHLRDIVVTEYGIADLRGRTDAECADRLIRIADSRFQAGLIRAARKAGKLPADYALPAVFRNNTPASLERQLGALRTNGTLPSFPLGTEFDEDEQRLVEALTWLRENARGWGAKLRTGGATLWGGRPSPSMRAPLERMGLDSARSPKAIAQRRLLALALRRSG